MSVIPDRMQKLGDLPDIDPSADRRVVTPRPVVRDYDLLILPAATLDLDGIAEARLVLDQGERDIRAYRARKAELAAYDAGERDGLCSWADETTSDDGASFPRWCRQPAMVTVDGAPLCEEHAEDADADPLPPNDSYTVNGGRL